MAVTNNEAYVGARKEIAFTLESPRGTAATAIAGDWQPHEGYDFGPMVEKLRDERARGRIENPMADYLHRRSSEGSAPLGVTKDFIGHILRMLFGQAPVTTGPSTSLYTHQFTVKNGNQHNAYTITVKDPVKGMLKYALGMVNEAAFDFNTDDTAKVNLSLMASKEESSAAASPAYSTTYQYPLWMPQEITYRLADNLAGLAAASDRDAASVPVTFSKNTAKRFALGQDYPMDVVNQRLAVGGSLTSVYDDTELRDLGHTRITKAMQIKLDDGAGTILTLQFPKVGFETWNDKEDNDAYMDNTVNWFAEYDDTDGLVKATLVNLVASY